MTPDRKGQEAGTGDFASDYADALRLHAAQPGEAGLTAAYELGRQALDRGFSMLELVAMHLELRRAIVQEVGIAPLRDLDAFLSEALAAFEITQQGYVESHRAAAAERDRAEWLGGLSEAYLAIAGAETLKERLEQVCIQAQRFLNAADAHLVLGRTVPADPTPGGGDVMSALLHGGVGCLSVTAPPGRRWDEQDRTTLQQLAVLISAPIDDARRLEMAHSSGQLGALLGGVADPEAVLSSFVGAGVEAIGARRAFVHLLDGDGGAGEGAPAADAVARSGEPTFSSGRGEEPGVAILPLGSAAERLGAVILEFDDGQPFDEVQRAFLIDVSDRLTAALERSRAYARERRSSRVGGDGLAAAGPPPGPRRRSGASGYSPAGGAGAVAARGHVDDGPRRHRGGIHAGTTARRAGRPRRAQPGAGGRPRRRARRTGSRPDRRG